MTNSHTLFQCKLRLLGVQQKYSLVVVIVVFQSINKVFFYKYEHGFDLKSPIILKLHQNQ